MASTPSYTSAPVLATASLSVGNAVRDNSNSAIVDAAQAGAAFVAPAKGARINKVLLQSTGRPADSTVLMFVHNGTIYQLVNEFDIGAPAVSSATAAAYRLEIPITDLDLPSGFKLGFAVTVTPTTGSLLAHVLGGLYT